MVNRVIETRTPIRLEPSDSQVRRFTRSQVRTFAGSHVRGLAEREKDGILLAAGSACDAAHHLRWRVSDTE